MNQTNNNTDTNQCFSRDGSKKFCERRNAQEKGGTTGKAANGAIKQSPSLWWLCFVLFFYAALVWPLMLSTTQSSRRSLNCKRRRTPTWTIAIDCFNCPLRRWMACSELPKSECRRNFQKSVQRGRHLGPKVPILSFSSVTNHTKSWAEYCCPIEVLGASFGGSFLGSFVLFRI